MTIIHHPSDATLAAFASGSLDEARGIVVAAHLSLCAQCRNVVHAFEAAGGALLDDVEPVALSAGALQRAMAALALLDVMSPAIRGEGAAGDLPAPLSHYAVGPWRWIGRGVQWRPGDVASHEGGRVFMLNAQAGTKLPRHRHNGTEWNSVYYGALTHDLGLSCAGDFTQADVSVEHTP